MVTKRSSLPQKFVGFYEAESGLAVGLVLKAKHEKPAKSFERFKNQTFFSFDENVFQTWGAATFRK